MSTITIEIKAVELSEAIKALAGAIVSKGPQVINYPTPKITVTPAQQTPTQPIPVQAPVQQAPVQVPQQPPVQQAPVQQAAAPTVPVSSAPTYTLDMLSRACSDLIKKSEEGQPAVWELMQKFGVVKLTDLPEEQYGAMATELRRLGASI